MEVGGNKSPILITNNVEKIIKRRSKERRLVMSQHKEGNQRYTAQQYEGAEESDDEVVINSGPVVYENFNNTGGSLAMWTQMSNTPDQTIHQDSKKSIHKMNETQQYLTEVNSKLDAM